MVTKNQHYVPQLLLKQFANQSGDESRTNVYDIERHHFRPNQNIRNVCSGNYTYDKDNSFESFLGQHVEGPVAPILEELLTTRPPGHFAPNIALVKFVLVQLARTRQAYESHLEACNRIMQTIFAETARMNDLDPEIAATLRMEPSEPRQILTYLAAYAATQCALLSDLTMCIVTNNTDTEFILSDHPVFQYNWYLRQSQHPLRNSITVRGVQFFVPISPSVTVCLYDASVYSYRGASKKAPITASPQDVLILNSFQALNADSLLLARSKAMEHQLQALGRRYSSKQAFSPSAGSTRSTEHEDGTFRSTHWVIREQTSVPAMPAFIKVKNRFRRKPIDCAWRSPDLVADQKVFNEEMERQRNIA